MPEYEVNWHHEVMCECLDRFITGEIKRLMIFTAPRHGKSELVSRRLPAFLLGRDPNATIIAASYGSDLAARMNRDVQRIMDSDEYRRIFPNTRLFGKNIRTVADGSWLRNSDMFEVVEYKGYYRGAGVGGAITGMGMVRGIIDDPIKNRQEANSQTVRDAIWDWYISTFRTRLAPGGGILLTVTRWHEDDLAGRLLNLAKNEPKADQWTVISLPAISEEPVAAYDKRTQPGQAIWPERFSEEELSATRLSLGSYEWNALYQQRPRPLEGGMFKRSWFPSIETLPAQAWRIRYWDKAATHDGGAYTSGVRLSITPNGLITIEDVARGQWSTYERRVIMKQTAQADAQQFQNSVVIGIEQEPGSSGVDSVQDEIKLLAGYPVFADRPSGDKTTRLMPFAAQAEAGNARVLQAPWNREYIEEMTAIPNGKYRDQGDATSAAYNRCVELINDQGEQMVVYDEDLTISPY